MENNTDLRLENTAILVIDMQNDFCNENGVLRKEFNFPDFSTNCIKSIQNLIDFSRKLEKDNLLPIVWIQADYSKEKINDAFNKKLMIGNQQNKVCISDWGCEIIDSFSPKISNDKINGKEIRIFKNYFDAFTNTDLKEILQKRGIENLIITGVSTQVCVESTVRSGLF